MFLFSFASFNYVLLVLTIANSLWSKYYSRTLCGRAYLNPPENSRRFYCILFSKSTFFWICHKILDVQHQYITNSKLGQLMLRNTEKRIHYSRTENANSRKSMINFDQWRPKTNTTTNMMSGNASSRLS